MPDRRAPEGPDAPAGALQGLHVLVVEDEYLLAEELRLALVAQGATVMGPARRVDAALTLLDRGPPPSVAILDVNLQGRMVWPVADALIARRIPVVLVTGYDAQAIPAAYAAIPRSEKPVELGQLVGLLLSALG